MLRKSCFVLTQALVRYATANEATTAWEKAQGEAEDGKVKLDDKELSATVLEGIVDTNHHIKHLSCLARF